jgi:transcriptional regulator with XRE-family HTH domain
MAGKIKELRGLIYSKFDSESEMAKKLGWPRQRLNKITNGIKEPDIKELNELAEALDKSVGDIAQIFLNCESPNGQQTDSA